MPERLSPALRGLASAWGVQTSYRDVAGVRRAATRDAVVGVLRALGAPIEGPGDAADALRARSDARWRTVAEPVVVARQGVLVRAPADVESARFELRLEGGGDIAWEAPLRGTPVAHDDERRFLERALPVPPELPDGYHALHVTAGAACADSMLIAAPVRGTGWRGRRAWGVMMPTYAIRTARDWGAGDLEDLAALLEAVGSMGGSVVQTLPLLPTFPDEPSPYSPVTRLHWSDTVLAPESLPGLDRAPDAREAIEAAARGRARLRELPAVDHDAVAALKRPVIDAVARALGDEVDGLVGDDVRAYARFRAATEAAGPWPGWGRTAPDGDPAVARYHAYAQHAARTQLAALGARAREAGSTLLFDLPIGVHPHGYDAWRYREAFAQSAHVGAPPDSFFTKGQDWSFHPLHPERVRRAGYAYPIACLRHLLSVARVLRIDHVMGIHRLWWIPEGHDARDGAYVRYPAEETYAILAVESRRAEALVIGEDLGTVPREVRRAMAAHDLHRTYVVQEELEPETESVMRPVPQASVASLNTHDMPPFAMFWRGLDIERRERMGLFDAVEAEAERERRALVRDRIVARLRTDGLVAGGDEREVLAGLLRWLGSSRARLVVPNLEDLWGETEPQNVPGTKDGNWARRGRYPIDGPEGLVGAALLGELEARRRGRG